MSPNRTGSGSPQSSPSHVVTKSGYILPQRPIRYEPIETKGPSIFRQWIVPCVCMALGLAGWVLEIRHHGSINPLQFTAYAAGGILFSGISLTLGLLAAAQLMGAELDTLAAMVVKIMGIALFVGACAALVASIDSEVASIRGVLVALHLVLLLYFICLTYLFQLDLLDGFTAAVISLVVQAGLIMTVAQALPAGAAKLML